MDAQDCQRYLPANRSWTIFRDFPWRPGDVVISPAAKQGSTWMQNIVHQRRTGGDGTFEDVGQVVPQPERIEHPGQTDGERLHGLAEGGFVRYSPRAIKTHAFPPEVPVRPELRYLVPVRNGKDSLVSFYHYRSRTSSAFRTRWGGRPQPFPSFAACFDCYLTFRSYWSCIRAWLPYRDAENVLLIHYSDLKRDLDAGLRQVAAFLRLEIRPREWPRILEYCGYRWMREHSGRFESATIEQGGMVRRGAVGEHRQWLSPEQEARWEAVHRELLPDTALRAWCDQGGILPQGTRP